MSYSNQDNGTENQRGMGLVQCNQIHDNNIHSLHDEITNTMGEIIKNDMIIKKIPQEKTQLHSFW